MEPPLDDEAARDDRRPEITPAVAWAAPLVGGVALAVAAAQLDNPLIPVGTAEVLTAFVLGAILRSAPFRIGALLVLPAAAYVLLARADDLSGWLSTFVLFVVFALFNGLSAGGGADWAAGIGRRRRDRRRPGADGTG